MKEGEYVRTKHFGINKIKGFYSDVYYDYIKVDDDLIKKEDIIKSSPNIIDLIEVGDYVNGYLVIEKDINNELRYIDLKDRNMKYVKYLDIESIVTKEQFEAMEYKLEVKDE